MKKVLKIISVVLSIALLAGTVSVGAAALERDNEKKQLRFNSNGSFKILVFADCQDTFPARKALIKEMNLALDKIKPDLVVFTGDNSGSLIGGAVIRAAIGEIVKPVESRGIPFAYVFGNHDAEHVSKKAQMKAYSSYEGCMTYDAAPEITGAGNCNLPIYASDGSDKAVFNLWMIDSNMYDEENGGYDCVHQDQLDWYKKTSDELAAENGGKVPSIVFQHIPVQEIFELLKPGDEVQKFGYSVDLELDPAKATGHIGECPCPPTVNSGELDAFVEQGDVLAIVTGHDHVNSFVGTVDGIDFLQTAGIGFIAYGDKQRGCRVITLDESNPGSYTTDTYEFADFFGNDYYADYIYTYYGSVVPLIMPPFFNNWLDKYMKGDKGPERFEKLKKLFAIFDR